MRPSTLKIAVVATVLVMTAGACGSSDDTAASDASVSDSTTPASVEVTTAATAADPTIGVTDDGVASNPATSTTDTAATVPEPPMSTFQIDVWADNWMAVYVDGEPIGEDSVPITTERSFNAESFVFEASDPFTIAIEAKDFMETDSGLEYIGERNQQMGDGGLIAQVTELGSGDVVAVTDGEWSALVVHQAPLNTDCEDDPDPAGTCEFLILDTPVNWTAAEFDDSGWPPATEWSEAAVSPKDGYDAIEWETSAQLVWGADLEVDNTVLLRYKVG